ncbi:MAG: ABC transporter ATP-binding protein [Actinomycetota bacterium]
MVKRLIALAPGTHRRINGLSALLLLATGTYVGQGVLIARILASIFSGDELQTLVGEIAGIAFLQVVRAGVLAIKERLSLAVSARAKEAVREAIVAKLLQLGPGTLQRTRTGTIQSTAVDAVEMLDPLVGRFLPQITASIVGASAITGYIFTLDASVGAVILVCAVVAPLVPRLTQRLLESRTSAWMLSYRGLYAENLDALQGMATLKAFNASHRRGAELSAYARQFCRDSTRLMAAWCSSSGGIGLAVGAGTVISVGLAAVHRAQGTLSTPELFTILILARECFRPFNDFQQAYHSSYQAIPSCKRIFELLDTTPDVVDVRPEAKPDISVPPSVAFEQISFTYPHRDQPALSGFSLAIATGERVALVGRSGSGKTTALSLLLRFFELQQGRIVVGGKDVREFGLPELRSLIGVVAQDTYLFHGTVRENLVLGRAGATDEQIEDAALAARAHQFIHALPRGYDTIVGERGLKLSGGERQRIAIARALLKDAPILVLDEPTSSVDSSNEVEIQRALDELTRGRTTLVIAHRLSTVRNADRIVVLDGGKVLESGGHESLIAQGGAYSRLVAAQTEGTR